MHSDGARHHGYDSYQRCFVGSSHSRIHTQREICFQHSTGGIVLPIYEQKKKLSPTKTAKKKRM